jgi:hypothetical protein
VTRSPLSSHIGCILLRRGFKAGPQVFDGIGLNWCPECPFEPMSSGRFLYAG